VFIYPTDYDVIIVLIDVIIAFTVYIPTNYDGIIVFISLQTMTTLLETFKSVAHELPPFLVMSSLCALQLILHCLPCLTRARKDQIIRRAVQLTGVTVTGQTPEQFLDSICSVACFRTLYHVAVVNLHKKVHAGGPALDVQLTTLDGTAVKLLDFQRAHRPLVVTFGSCT